MKRIDCTEYRTIRVGGAMYQIIRDIDYYPDEAYVTITARKWSGRQWDIVHRFQGYKEI